MLKAAALVYALVISLLISTVSGSLLLFSHLNEKEAVVLTTQEELLRNAHSGLNLLLASTEDLPAGKVVTKDLFGETSDTVQLLRRQWGAYQIAAARATRRGKLAEKMAMTGTSVQDYEWPALYLADISRKLTLAGKTTIKGDAYLPRGGVERGYLEGQPYNNAELIFGKQLASQNRLPQLNASLLEVNRAYLKQDFLPLDSVVEFDAWPGVTLNHPFFRKTLVLYKEGTIDLSGLQLAGNVILVSERSIYINASTQLQNVVCYAPEIIIAEGFSGQAQLIASEKISLEENSNLTYPSTVMVLLNEKADNETNLELAEGATVEGAIVTHLKTINNRYWPVVKTAPESVVKGFVYVPGNIEHKGIIEGSLYCNKFILKGSGSYENALLNATIDRTALSDHFVGAGLFEETPLQKVIQWL